MHSSLNARNSIPRQPQKVIPEAWHVATPRLPRAQAKQIKAARVPGVLHVMPRSPSYQLASKLAKFLPARQLQIARTIYQHRLYMAVP